VPGIGALCLGHDALTRRSNASRHIGGSVHHPVVIPVQADPARAFSGSGRLGQSTSAQEHILEHTSPSRATSRPWRHQPRRSPGSDLVGAAFLDSASSPPANAVCARATGTNRLLFQARRACPSAKLRESAAREYMTAHERPRGR